MPDQIQHRAYKIDRYNVQDFCQITLHLPVDGGVSLHPCSTMYLSYSGMSSETEMQKQPGRVADRLWQRDLLSLSSSAVSIFLVQCREQRLTFPLSQFLASVVQCGEWCIRSLLTLCISIEDTLSMKDYEMLSR